MNQKHEYSKGNERIRPSKLKKMFIGGIAVIAAATTIFGIKTSENQNNQSSSGQTVLAEAKFDVGGSYANLAKEVALIEGINPNSPGYQSTIDNSIAVAEALNNSAEPTPQTVIDGVPIIVDAAYSHTTTVSGNGVTLYYNLPKQIK